MGNVYLSYAIVRDRYGFDKEDLVETGVYLDRKDLVERNVVVSESDWNGAYVAKILYDAMREYVSNDEEGLMRVGSVFEIEQYEDEKGNFVPNDRLKDVDYLARYALFLTITDSDFEVLDGEQAERVTLRELSKLNLSEQEYIVSFDNEDDHEKYAYESDLDMN